MIDQVWETWWFMYSSWASCSISGQFRAGASHGCSESVFLQSQGFYIGQRESQENKPLGLGSQIAHLKRIVNPSLTWMVFVVTFSGCNYTFTFSCFPQIHLFLKNDLNVFIILSSCRYCWAGNASQINCSFVIGNRVCYCGLLIQQNLITNT